MSPSSTGELTTRIAYTGPLVPSAKGGGPPRLVVLMGMEPGRRYSLDEEVIVVGRGEECEIQLDDTKVSRRHARIMSVQEKWVIEDLKSRNGTLVNGELVKVAELAIGDRIQLSAETLLLFTRQDPLEDLLLHRQQMEVIGQLAAGIAHDFNNLLNVISASVAHLVALDGGTALGNAEVRECHDDITVASRRAAELTARLLTIARRREQHRTPGGQEGVDVTALCADVLQLVRRTFDRSIDVVPRVEDGLAVGGDHGALHQLLMNLCINARDAMPAGGRLLVSARLEGRDGSNPSDSFGPTEQVVLEVTDFGMGMDEKTRLRVFEPFFTTKAKGAGSGLGLATVYEVATNHGGLVEVESVVGEGSTFRVRLPARPPQDEVKRKARKRSTSTWDGRLRGATSGRVLVVDDQKLVRRSLGRLLKAAGHEITYAEDGIDALEVYAASDPRPEVVLMDLDMPRLSGADTLVRLREMDPHACVVLISGYHDDTRKQRLLSQGAVDFLGKPVDARELRAAVLRALAQSPGT